MMAFPKMSHFETCGICHTGYCDHNVGMVEFPSTKPSIWLIDLAPNTYYSPSREVLTVDGVELSLYWLKKFINMPKGTITRHDGRDGENLIFTDLTRAQLLENNRRQSQYVFDMANGGLRQMLEREKALTSFYRDQHKKWPYRFVDWVYLKMFQWFGDPE